MPLRNQLPPSLRYRFKAKSRPLRRPAFWGAAIFIFVVGLVTLEYLVNPEWLGSLLKNEVAELEHYSNSSKFEQRRTIAEPIAPDQETQETKTKELYENFLAQKQATFSPDSQPSPITVTGKPAAPSANTVDTPLLIQAKNLLQARPKATDPQAPPTNALEQSSPNSALPSQTRPPTTQASAGTGYNPPAATNTSPPANFSSYLSGSDPVTRLAPYSALVASPVTPGTTSPVQPAVNQSAIANHAAGLTAPQAPTNYLGQSLPSSALPSQTSPLTTKASNGTSYNSSPAATNTTPGPNSYTYFVQPQRVPSVAPHSTPGTPPGNTFRLKGQG